MKDMFVVGYLQREMKHIPSAITINPSILLDINSTMTLS